MTNEEITEIQYLLRQAETAKKDFLELGEFSSFETLKLFYDDYIEKEKKYNEYISSIK